MAFEVYGLSQPGMVSISTIRSGADYIYTANISDVNDLSPLVDEINNNYLLSWGIKAFAKPGGMVVYRPSDSFYPGEGLAIRNFISNVVGNTVKIRSLDFETYKPITGKTGASDSITLTSLSTPNTDPNYLDANISAQVRITAEEGPISWNIVEDRIPGSSRGLTFSDPSGETSSGSTPIDLTTIESARSALDAIDFQISRISSARSEVGAKNNRLEAISSQIDTSVLSSQAARGRIVDSDYAVEQSNLVRSKILTESATAIVAQANAEPQIVKTLLDSIS